jgi:hypothetical protein
MKYILLLIFVFPLQVFAQASMRRCTLLPITDSVGGAIAFKVFEEVEESLKKSNWCTYVSNSGLINVFSRYRENLASYLKQKEVLKTVAEKLQVGSLIRVALVNEIKGVEIQMEVHGDDGEDIYFSEKTLISTDEIESIAQTVNNWLDTYSKTIPYDAKINGILGDQVTMDVGKGYPIQVTQGFIVKRPVSKKKHPLLKKIVDWETEVLAEGKVFNISDNQALGMVKVYTTNKKLVAGDWIRLEPMKQDAFTDPNLEEKKEEEPGTLGIVSVALFGASSSVDTATPTGSKRMNGKMFGFDFRGEGWITRQYFAALEIARSVGKLSEVSGNPEKSSTNAQFGVFKLTGGYKYLPIGFFYGPQIDIYGGYANYSFDLDYSAADGFGKGTISGILLGVAANIPINREYRFMVQADFLPFPSFEDSDDIFGASSSASALDLEIGLKYQYTPRMTLDGSIETLAAKAKFDGDFKEISYHDNIKLKFGASFNF